MTPQGVAEPTDEPQAALIATCRCRRRIWRLTLDSARWRHDNGGVTCAPAPDAVNGEANQGELLTGRRNDPPFDDIVKGDQA